MGHYIGNCGHCLRSNSFQRRSQPLGITHTASKCAAFQTLLPYRSSYCFPPNTHAFLHLGEMMRQFGPLINISQFKVERFVGEICPSAKSRVKPETNMFNKTNNLFCLRLLNGGMGANDLCENLYADESLSDHQTHPVSQETFGNVLFFGLSTLLKDRRRLLKAEACARSYFGEKNLLLEVISVQSFEKCLISPQLTIETERALKRRLRTTEGARQKCWIAAEFECCMDKRSGGQNDSGHADSDTSDDGTRFFSDVEKTKTYDVDVYYGLVHDIWKALVRYKDVESNIQHEISLHMAEIDWMYGLARDKRSGVIYTNMRRGKQSHSIKNVVRTTETATCIDRLIAYFDFCDRRFLPTLTLSISFFLLDTKKKEIDNSENYTLREIA